MSEVTATQSGFVRVAADLVYDLIADYSEHHRHILPPAFSNYRVQEGGRGAGTVVSVDVTLQGVTRTARLRISEPDPGHVLEEFDEASGARTRFLVETIGGGCTVTIHTRFPRSGGVRGLAESILAAPMLRRLYRKELALLASYATKLCA